MILWLRVKKSEAIKILKKQRDKVDDGNTPHDETWVFQTASYIKKFFGEGSDEYNFMCQFHFHVKYVHGTLDADEVKILLREKRNKVKTFLDGCIETINDVGLYRRKKENFLKTLPWYSLLGLSLTIGGIIFSIGFWAGKRDGKEKSALPVSTTNSPANPKEDKAQNTKPTTD